VVDGILLILACVCTAVLRDARAACLRPAACLSLGATAAPWKEEVAAAARTTGMVRPTLGTGALVRWRPAAWAICFCAIIVAILVWPQEQVINTKVSLGGRPGTFPEDDESRRLS